MVSKGANITCNSYYLQVGLVEFHLPSTEDLPWLLHISTIRFSITSIPNSFNIQSDTKIRFNTASALITPKNLLNLNDIRHDKLQLS